jgi:hypothetical protein
MAIQVQLRRGTTSQNNAFTGAVGEITVDTTINTVRVHDGTTAGGTALVSTDGAQTLTNKTLTSPTIQGVGLVSITGNITGGNVTATANVTGGNLITTGIASVTGNITGGNITVTGLANVNSALVAATTNSTSTTSGALRVSGGAGIAGNIYAGGLAEITGNITGGNLTTAGVLTVNSNNAVSAIINGGSNAVGNIGSSSGYFNTAFVKATSAQYADLAEMYQADEYYEPGTVLSFGGPNDVTISVVDSDRRVAGVVSTDPAYIMNSVMDAPNATPVALMGKVPTKVIGPVSKGDLMVSAGNGYARADANPSIGSVIGKALEESQGGTGVINVVVGRL